MMHTPEPWVVGKTYKFHADIDAPNGDPSIGYAHWTGHVSCHSSDGEPEIGAAIASANANRIVACVNACAGINPEVVSAVKTAVANLRKLNDEHEKARIAIRSTEALTPEGCAAYDLCNSYANAVMRAEAAIIKMLLEETA